MIRIGYICLAAFFAAILLVAPPPARAGHASGMLAAAYHPRALYHPPRRFLPARSRLPRLRKGHSHRLSRSLVPMRRFPIGPAARNRPRQEPVRLASPYGNVFHRPAFRPRRKLPPAFRPPRRPPRDPAIPPPAGSRRIAPSQALRKVLRVIPGSLGLGVELLPGAPPVYAVKLKTGSRIRRVLVDAVSGRVLDR